MRNPHPFLLGERDAGFLSLVFHRGHEIIALWVKPIDGTTPRRLCRHPPWGRGHEFMRPGSGCAAYHKFPGMNYCSDKKRPLSGLVPLRGRSACQKSIFAKLLTNFRTSKSSEIRRLIERAGDFFPDGPGCRYAFTHRFTCAKASVCPASSVACPATGGAPLKPPHTPPAALSQQSIRGFSTVSMSHPLFGGGTFSFSIFTKKDAENDNFISNNLSCFLFVFVLSYNYK